MVMINAHMLNLSKRIRIRAPIDAQALWVDTPQLSTVAPFFFCVLTSPVPPSSARERPALARFLLVS